MSLLRRRLLNNSGIRILQIQEYDIGQSSSTIVRESAISGLINSNNIIGVTTVYATTSSHTPSVSISINNTSYTPQRSLYVVKGYFSDGYHYYSSGNLSGKYNFNNGNTIKTSSIWISDDNNKGLYILSLNKPILSFTPGGSVTIDAGSNSKTLNLSGYYLLTFQAFEHASGAYNRLPTISNLSITNGKLSNIVNTSHFRDESGGYGSSCRTFCCIAYLNNDSVLSFNASNITTSVLYYDKLTF